MIKANFKDLKLEYWLRAREKGLICWETKDGRNVPIKDMSDEHLVNTLRMIQRTIERREQEEWEEWQLRDIQFDMDPLDYGNQPD